MREGSAGGAALRAYAEVSSRLDYRKGQLGKDLVKRMDARSDRINETSK